MKRFLATLFLLALPFTVSADDLTEDRVRELVLETIRENPGIILEAVNLYEQQQRQAQAAAQARIVDAERDTLERDPNAPVLGNPDGDVTIVEFFDYNCPYCRQVKPEIEALLAADPDIRLVYREWPILGEGSVFAARAALAARNQGLYEAFHWALMGLKRPADETSVMRVAAEVGLDPDQLRADMDAPEIDEHIATSMRLTRALGLQGTPSFVIGDALVPGLVQREQLKALAEQVRAGAD